MYWPIGTPKAFAITNNVAAVSIDISPDLSSNANNTTTLELPESQLGFVENALPQTPITPLTPAVHPIQYEDVRSTTERLHRETPATPDAISTKEPIRALRISRSGHIFAVITATTMTIWQTKVQYLYL